LIFFSLTSKMKFFSAALAAFAVGSAVAAPVLDAQSLPLPTPCRRACGGKPGLGLDCPSVTGEAIQVTQTALPGSGNGNGSGNHNGNPGHVDNHDVIVVVDAAVEVVVAVEAKVKAHLDLIGTSSPQVSADHR